MVGKYTFANGDTATRVSYYSRKRARTTAPNGMEFIYDTQLGRVSVIDHAKRRYYTGTIAEADSLAEKILLKRRAELRPLIEANREKWAALMSGFSDSILVDRTEETVTIAGYPSTRWTLRAGSYMTHERWAARGLSVPNFGPELEKIVMAVILARALPSLAESWGHPSFPVALALGGALTTAASQQGPKLGRRNALLDTLFGAGAVVVAVALYHPHVAVRSLIFTLVGGAALGGLFAGLARWILVRDPEDAAVAAFAVVLAGAGFSYATRLSPFVVCALAAAVFMSLSPPAVRRAVVGLLTRWEHGLYAVFLVVTGALLSPLSPWVLVAAPVLALIRVVVRWVTVRFGLDQVDPVWRSLPFAPPREFAQSPVRQGASAVALAAGFDLVRGAPWAVLVTILLSVMAAEAVAARTLLTASARQAEVS